MDDRLPVLVDRAVSGDLDAFAELVGRLRPRFSRYALRMVGNREDAEEALQDALVRVYRRLATCRDPAKVEAWAFSILVNRCRTRAGRLSRLGAIQISGVAPGAEEARVAHPAHALGWREEIERALGRLPSEQREAFLLRHVEGLSYGEMVEVTGAGLSALKMRVLRACESMRRDLQGAMD